MANWEEALGLKWPSNQCDQSGECCRGAAQYEPWANLLRQAAKGDLTARNFLSQYQPYANQTDAIASAPDAVEASLRIASERGQKPESVIFYRCIFLKGTNQCQIYEDRPTLCRDFPESPFGAIPKCCGYYATQQACYQIAHGLRQELETLRKLQTLLRENP